MCFINKATLTYLQVNGVMLPHCLFSLKLWFYFRSTYYRFRAEKLTPACTHIQTEATSNQRQTLSYLLCQEALLFFDPSLSFLLFTFTPCLFLSVTWVSCSIVKNAPPPSTPLTHLHTHTHQLHLDTPSHPLTPQPQLPAPPVAFLGAHCTFKENMREA